MDPTDPLELARAIRDRVGDRSIAIAESCTAGALTAALAEAGDAAGWLRGALVAYQDDLKHGLLGVTADSVVTLEAADQMVRGIADLLGGEIAIATTGVLGEDPVDETPPATVMVATLVDDSVRTARLDLADTADRGRDEAIGRVLEQLLDHLRDVGS